MQKKKTLTNEVEYFTHFDYLSSIKETKTTYITTPLVFNNQNPCFYFDCDLNARTYYEDYIINYLLVNGYHLTSDITKATYFLGYQATAYEKALVHSFKKVVSFSTMVYPALTIGIDENDLLNTPLNKQLKTDVLNDIDKLNSDFLIIHGQNEKRHPWLQAAFLYSSLKDRKPNLKTKMLIIPNIDETLYDKPSSKILNDIVIEIFNFFNDEQDH